MSVTQVRKCDNVVYCRRDCDRIRIILNSVHLQTADCQLMATSQPWGWSDYFMGLSRFLESLERQYGIANESFSEYAVT